MAPGLPGEGRAAHVRRRSRDRAAFLWGLAAAQPASGGGGCPRSPRLPSRPLPRLPSLPLPFPSPAALVSRGVAEEASGFPPCPPRPRGEAPPRCPQGEVPRGAPSGAAWIPSGPPRPPPGSVSVPGSCLSAVWPPL